jgi:DNA anti-recombination protein RmuC
MRTIRSIACISFLLLAFLGFDPVQAGQRSYSDLNEKVMQLDQRIGSLEQEIRDMDRAHERELTAIRKDLQHIIHYFNISFDHLKQSLDRDSSSLEQSTKEAVKSSLEKLLELSREILDKIEKDLQQETPSNKGVE